jgi:hypothetical protein
MYYRKLPVTSGKMKINETYEGEPLEAKIRRIVDNKEPIEDGAPIIYTDRKDGVQKAYDIRTDRFEVAVEAMDKVTKTEVAKREQRIGERTWDTMSAEQQEAFKTKFPNSKLSQPKTE